MEPTIKAESFIFGVRLVGELNVGDVIVFEHDGHLLVKRIAALPSDTVVIDGEALTIPDGCYFMLGDNAEASIDSRYWDEPFVERAKIIAVLPHK
jgi:signal peptidase I